MSSRMGTLQKLAGLYGVVERMRLSELELALRALHEAEEAIGVQQRAQRMAGCDGREALRTSDAMSWSVAEMQGETATWRRFELEELRVSLTDERNESERVYLRSRVESEQVQHVLREALRDFEVKRVRREQAESDDRFLARRRWKESRSLTVDLEDG